MKKVYIVYKAINIDEDDGISILGVFSTRSKALLLLDELETPFKEQVISKGYNPNVFYYGYGILEWNVD